MKQKMEILKVKVSKTVSKLHSISGYFHFGLFVNVLIMIKTVTSHLLQVTDS